MKPVKHATKYIAVTITAFAVFDFILTKAIHRGFDLPQRHPIHQNTWIVEKDVLSAREWNDLQNKHQVFLGFTWLFATVGASVTLPGDWNPGNNQVNAVGAGSAGVVGSSGFFCSCGGGTGSGGNGGAGGAWAQILNYPDVAGTVVAIQVGAGDTFWKNTATLLAKAASGTTAGQASASVGTSKNSGGAGGINGGLGQGSGGGGGGGPHGVGGAGATGGAGGTGDGGTVAAGANGAQFGPTSGGLNSGPGGGGAGGAQGSIAGGPGSPGGAGGFYGAGGGGGGGGTGNGQPGGSAGNATQGLLAYAYVPLSAGGSRAYVLT